MRKLEIIKIISVMLIVSGLISTGSAFDGYSYGEGGGGYGGMGVITKESLDNIADYQTITGYIIAGTPVKYLFSKANLAIYEVIVTGDKNEQNAAMRIELLKSASKVTKSPAPGNLYRYENIWFGSDNFKDIIIRFRVKNSWINDNNVLTKNIKMLAYDVNKTDWIESNVRQIDEDEDYKYFEYKTDHFSAFAISEIKETKESTGVQEKTETGKDTIVDQTVTTTEPRKPLKEKTPGFEFVIAIFVISIMAYMLKRN